MEIILLRTRPYKHAPNDINELCIYIGNGPEAFKQIIEVGDDEELGMSISIYIQGRGIL